MEIHEVDDAGVYQQIYQQALTNNYIYTSDLTLNEELLVHSVGKNARILEFDGNLYQQIQTLTFAANVYSL